LSQSQLDELQKNGRSGAKESVGPRAAKAARYDFSLWTQIESPLQELGRATDRQLHAHECVRVGRGSVPIYHPIGIGSPAVVSKIHQQSLDPTELGERSGDQVMIGAHQTVRLGEVPWNVVE